MRYLLKFINSEEHILRELNIDADDEDSAINYTCDQSTLFQGIVDLCEGDRRVARVTPDTANLCRRGPRSVAA